MRRTYILGWLAVSALIAAITLGSSALPGFAQDRSPLRIQDPLGRSVKPFTNSGVSDLKPFSSLEVTSGNPENLKPGDVVTLSITLLLPPESYTYSTNPAFGGGTKIQITKSNGLEAIDDEFETNKPPKKVLEPLLSSKPIEKFFDDVVWSKRFRVKKNADLTRISVSGTMSYQVCDDQRCRPLREKIQASLTPVTKVKQPKISKVKEPKVAEIPKAPRKKFPSQREIIPTGVGGKPQPVTFLFRLAPENAKPGETVTLSITASLEGSWHIYATTHDRTMLGKPTRIEVEAINGLKPIDADFTSSKKPESLSIPKLKIVQKVHHDEITWTKSFTVLDSASTDGFGVSGRLGFMICDKVCLPPTTVPFALGAVNEGNVQVVGSSKAVPLPSPAPAPAPKSEEKVAEAQQETSLVSQGLVPFLITAVLAGFAALLTPCVFPMIPITVSYFLKQSEKDHHKPVSMALVYCAGIVVTFTVIGLLMAVMFGAASLNKLANGPVLNVAIAGVLVFFGMNLLGMFEIRIPSWLLTWSAGKEGQGGMIGVLFMALTFTLVSFTCTFAFVGFLLVLAAKGDFYWPILGMLGFSAAFSLPFFFLALFPSYLHKLPKSGGWMNTVKVTMGMIELGAAFKFFSVADLAWFPEAYFFDYSLVMSAWMVIAICTGFYLLGMFRLPHDTPTEHISAIRLCFAMTFLGLAGYLAVGLFAPSKPTGKIWEQIAAFAPPEYESGSGDIGPYLEHDGLQYALDFERAFEYARQNNQPIFLDFTGENCINCRLMEHLMEKPELRERLTNFVRVRVYTDSVPMIPSQQEQLLLEKNRELQEKWFEDVSLPAYAVITPDREVLSKSIGQQSEDVFAKFLDEGLKKWNNRSENVSTENVVQHELVD
jgi:thiol:disulfide interchange protein